MNIFITGGLGYIGSYLIDNLHGCNITIVDNLLTQRYNTLFNRKTNFHFIEQDFVHIENKILESTDMVIHLAAICDASKSFEEQKPINQINTINTKIFLKKCLDYNIKIIFPSSTSVYGKSTDVVHEDDESVINPQSPYAKSKLEVEEFLKTFGTNYCILRLGTVCGVSKGIRFQTCINKFCYQASFGQPLTIWKQNLNMKRPYLSIYELGKIIQFATTYWYKFENQTYNVLTDNLTPKQITDKISKIIGETGLEIKYTDCPLLNQYSYIVSNRKLANYVYINNPNRINMDIENTLELLRKP